MHFRSPGALPIPGVDARHRPARPGALPRRRRRGLLAPAALAIALLGLSGCGHGDDAAVPRHLILITVDTWRGDHAFTTRAGVELTPRLSAFAAQAVHFSAAQSAANCTSPGTTALMTGLLPQRAGVVKNIHMLPRTVPTLATTLARAGFDTAGFVGNPVLAPEFGFGRGFDTYEFVQRQPGSTKVRARQVSRAALAWLDEHGEGERLFLWAHFMEPHGPYEPPARHAALFPTEAFDAPRDLELQPEGKSSGLGKVPAYQQVPGYDDLHDGREYLARYAAEVHALDDALGDLLDELDRRGLLERSVLVLTSDHGEALAGDHGYYFCHQTGLTQDQVHVPLLLRYPGCAAGTRRAEPVSLVDVLPTVLARLGVADDGARDGADLLADSGRAVASQSPSQMSLREGPWKLTVDADGAALLVNLDDDPGETDDLSARHPERVTAMRQELERRTAAAPLAEPTSRLDLMQR